MTSRIMAALEERIGEEEEGVEEEKFNYEGALILIFARRFSVQVQICGDGTVVGDETSGRPKLFLVFGTVKSNDF